MALLFLFGIGAAELAILLALLALLFGAPVVKGLGKKTGRAAGATQQARTEFEKGREE
jgi:Sec-independent protein translocase protein TatA